MNRRRTLCVTLAVLSLFCVWSVHSVGQDLFDGGDAPAAEDDLFGGGADGDDAIPSESSDDGVFLDDLSADDEPADDLFGGSSDDAPTADDASGISDEDLPRLDDATDLPPGDDDLGQLGVVELEVDVETPDALGINMPRNSSAKVIQQNVEVRTNLTRPPVSNQAFQARKRLERLQQTMLQGYMQTKNKSTRDKLVGQLTDSVRQEFDLRQKERNKELKALEQELKRLRSIHMQREREKDTIVRNRVRQLIRDKEGLGWGSETTSRRFR